MLSITNVQPVNCKISIHPFLLGVARLFDFAQVLNHPGSKNGDEVDTVSLENDWFILGNDMQIAIDKYSAVLNNGQ